MKKINKIISQTERIIIMTLLGFMLGVLVLAATEVGIIIIQSLSNPFETNGIIIDVDGLIDIFGFFLTVLIGLELFETVKLYLKENVFHGEVILLVSLIAVSRKVIVLDYSKEDPLTLIAIAALIASISLGYFLIKKSSRRDKTVQNNN